MTTEAPSKTPSKTAAEAPEPAEGKVDNASVPATEAPPADPTPDPAEEARAAQEEALEILEPKAEPKRWVIGKPPEAGGSEDEYSVYVQKPLGYMARMRFFSLVSSTIAKAIRASGNPELGELDIRTARSMRAQDFEDAGSFFTLAMQLVSYSPDFLLECYCLWLSVPPNERTWAKMVLDQPYDPDNNKWGLTEDDGMEMIEVFIDQNYEDIRRFFSEKLPRLLDRARQREEERQGRASTSALSKR